MAAETPERPEGVESEVGRRVLLRGMAAMGLAAVTLPLAACGSDDEPSTAAEGTPEASPDAGAPSPEATVDAPKATKTPKGSPSADPSASAKPTKTAEASPKASPKASPAAGKLVKDGNTPLASAADIPVNSGMLFEADGYIVTQPKAGTYIGFDDLCTHEGCPVDVFDTPGVMSCSCHSSNFDITTGAVKSGPAKKPMPKKDIIVEGGQIYKAKKA